ncbi:MAG: metallophosphoesterase family protein [Christensenellaceae bacterium]
MLSPLKEGFFASRQLRQRSGSDGFGFLPGLRPAVFGGTDDLRHARTPRGRGRPAALCAGDILLNGHTHVPCVRELSGGILYANCGSVALPKENTPHSYLVLEKGKMLWKDLGKDGEIFDLFDL